MGGYANLQLKLDDRIEAAHERVVYAVTAYMDAQGMMPCGRDSAERTVCFARISGGFAVYDDCADRLDISALDGLARALTGKLRTTAVGVMASGREPEPTQYMLRLYHDGRLRDDRITAPGVFGQKADGLFRRLCCRGKTVLWRPFLREGRTVRELSAVFLRVQRGETVDFHEVSGVLNLGFTAKFGFASLEDSGLKGTGTLYFCAANRVRQRWFDRFLRPARRTATTLGAMIRPPRCKDWR